MDAPPIVDGVTRIGDLLDPIGEAAEEVAVIVGEAGGEIERTVRTDGAYGTGRDAELAFETGIIVDRVVVGLDFGLNENRASRTKLPNFGWMRLR